MSSNFSGLLGGLLGGLENLFFSPNVGNDIQNIFAGLGMYGNYQMQSQLDDYIKNQIDLQKYLTGLGQNPSQVTGLLQPYWNALNSNMLTGLIPTTPEQSSSMLGGYYNALSPNSMAGLIPTSAGGAARTASGFTSALNPNPLTGLVPTNFGQLLSTGNMLTAGLNPTPMTGMVARTPEQAASMVREYQQPLSQDLIASVRRPIEAQLSEMGLSQAPNIMAETMAQALAPYQLQEQGQAISEQQANQAAAIQNQQAYSGMGLNELLNAMNTGVSSGEAYAGMGLDEMMRLAGMGVGQQQSAQQMALNQLLSSQGLGANFLQNAQNMGLQGLLGILGLPAKGVPPFNFPSYSFSTGQGQQRQQKPGGGGSGGAGGPGGAGGGGRPGTSGPGGWYINPPSFGNLPLPTNNPFFNPYAGLPGQNVSTGINFGEGWIDPATGLPVEGQNVSTGISYLAGYDANGSPVYVPEGVDPNDPTMQQIFGFNPDPNAAAVPGGIPLSGYWDPFGTWVNTPSGGYDPTSGGYDPSGGFDPYGGGGGYDPLSGGGYDFGGGGGGEITPFDGANAIF